MITQGRCSRPGRPGLGLTTFSPPGVICACATACGTLNFELVDVCKIRIMVLSKQVSVIYPVISAKPHQPVSFEFPKRFWKQVVVKSCQSAWFAKWPWLHYREGDDSVFCHTCVKAFKELKMPVRNVEDATSLCLLGML